MLDNLSDVQFNTLMYLFVFVGVLLIIGMYKVCTDDWYRNRIGIELQKIGESILGVLVLIKDYFSERWNE